MKQIKIHAPFFLHGVWSWLTFTTREPNRHAAIFDKAREIGATMWDTSQASEMIDGTCVFGSPTVFA